MEGIWFDGRYINPTKPDGITSFSLGLIEEVLNLTPLTVMVDSQHKADLLPKSDQLRIYHQPSCLTERAFFDAKAKQGGNKGFVLSHANDQRLGKKLQAGLHAPRHDLLSPPNSSRKFQFIYPHRLVLVSPELLATAKTSQPC
jgi:hypothetical protein